MAIARLKCAARSTPHQRHRSAPHAPHHHSTTPAAQNQAAKEKNETSKNIGIASLPLQACRPSGGFALGTLSAARAAVKRFEKIRFPPNVDNCVETMCTVRSRFVAGSWTRILAIFADKHPGAIGKIPSGTLCIDSRYASPRICQSKSRMELTSARLAQRRCADPGGRTEADNVADARMRGAGGSHAGCRDQHPTFFAVYFHGLAVDRRRWSGVVPDQQFCQTRNYVADSPESRSRGGLEGMKRSN